MEENSENKAELDFRIFEKSSGFPELRGLGVLVSVLAHSSQDFVDKHSFLCCPDEGGAPLTFSKLFSSG